VRKEGKDTHVIFAKPLTFNEGEDDERKIFTHRVFTVFNVAQIDGLSKEEEVLQLPPDEPRSSLQRHRQISGSEEDMAGYIPSKDYITLPPPDVFKSMESYYATTFHELGHWSGAQKRLASTI
jgi:antirestriction protein ArdC